MKRIISIMLSILITVLMILSTRKTEVAIKPIETRIIDESIDKHDEIPIYITSNNEEYCIDESIVELTQEEAEMIMKLAWSEAGNQGVEGQLVVMNVIMNRVENEDFPNTVREVIYQKHNGQYQFAVMGNGVFKKANPTSETHMALAELEGGKDISQGALFFESSSNSSKSWHRKNKSFLFEEYGQRFYK